MSLLATKYLLHLPLGNQRPYFLFFCTHSKQPEQWGAQDWQHLKESETIPWYSPIPSFRICLPLSGAIPIPVPLSSLDLKLGSLQYSPTAKLGLSQLESFVLPD